MHLCGDLLHDVPMVVAFAPDLVAALVSYLRAVAARFATRPDRP